MTSDDPRLTGVIVAIDGQPPTRLAVDVTSDDGSRERATILLAPETAVISGVGTARAIDAADLAIGARIEIRHTGAAMRSLPPQYRATQIRILGV